MLEIGEIRRAAELGYKGTYRYIWQACGGCAKERWVHLRKGKPASKRCLQCAMRGQNSFYDKASHWKGGRIKLATGYIYIMLPKDDFFYPMANKDGYVAEHRLVIAKALGRCLLSWETVHHKEGFAKDDNRYPKTLELLPNRYMHNALTKMVNYIRKLEAKIILLEA